MKATDERIAKLVALRLGGWVEHDGGDCPVPNSTIVVSQFTGETRDDAEAWGEHQADAATWNKDVARTTPSGDYVIAYRVVRYD